VLSSKQAVITASARDILTRLTREKLSEQAHTSHLGIRCAAMSIIDSLRVLGAMAQVTGPSLVEIVMGRLERDDVDERTHWFGRRVVELLDVDLHVQGGEHLSTDRAYVYMSNHQSHLDIPILYATLPSRTIRMLGKKELFQIPLWGRGLKAAEFIPVDRSNHARAVQSIEEAARLLRDGVCIYLAPEGTRSLTGKIGKLKKGGFHMAKDTRDAEGKTRRRHDRRADSRRRSRAA
jgi:1-acyl-sn-glycerol-3-phosphate acyltransferase